MAIKVNDVLTYLKGVAAAISGMSAERVHLGPVEPSKVNLGPHIIIEEISDRGEIKDGGKTDRLLRLLIAVALRIDPASSTDADIQINAIYGPMHAAFELMRHGVAGQFAVMIEDDQGAESETVWGQVAIRVKSCYWTINLERTHGATD